MAYRARITLNPEAFAFLQKMGGTNCSGYLNDLLKREQQRVLDANRDEARITYQQKFATWERTLADGLEPA